MAVVVVEVEVEVVVAAPRALCHLLSLLKQVPSTWSMPVFHASTQLNLSSVSSSMLWNPANCLLMLSNRDGRFSNDPGISNWNFFVLRDGARH